MKITDTGFGTPSGKVKIDGKIFTKREVYPAPRSRHCAVLLDNGRVVVHGGGGKDRIFDDLWVLDTNNMTWSQPKESGTKPSPRWGHSATLIGQRILVFGGVFENHMSSQLFELNTRMYIFDRIYLALSETWTWKEIMLPLANGIAPAPRAAHSATAFDKYLMVLWGGDDKKFLKELFIIDTGTY